MGSWLYFVLYIYKYRFSLLTNKSPFKGSNDRETIARIKELDYILPDNGNLVSNEACDLIRHLLTVVLIIFYLELRKIYY